MHFTWVVLEGKGNIKLFFLASWPNENKTKPTERERKRERATEVEDRSMGCVCFVMCCVLNGNIRRVKALVLGKDLI